MSDARAIILDRIRKANQSDVLPASSSDVVGTRLQKKQRGPLPQWTEEIELRFLSELQKSGGTVTTIHRRNELVSGITSYLNQHELPQRLLCAPSELFNELTWPDNFEIDRRAAETNDITVVTEAFAAVAETGSVVLCSSAETPTTLNFLPDNFLCVVQQDRIVAHLEDALDLIRQAEGQMPRAINFITGPSRTADVEQTIQMGAHGPRRVHVLLLV